MDRTEAYQHPWKEEVVAEGEINNKSEFEHDKNMKESFSEDPDRKEKIRKKREDSSFDP